MKKSNLSFLLVLLFWMPFAEKASKIFANKPLHRCYYRISNYHEDGKDEKALYSIDSLLKTQTEINSTLRGNIQKLKGDICLDLAQYENALEAYKASYALRLETYGEVQNGTLDSKNGIAETIFRLGDIDSALELHREILELRIEKDGEYSSDVADSYNNLGNCYFSKGLNEKAIDYHNYALNIRKYALSKVGNRFDDGIAVSYFNLGNIYFQEGKFEIALSYYQSAKENRHVRWRPPHPKLSKINFAIAKCLLHQGNLKDGIPLAENALEVFTNRFNQNHPILLNYYQTYASLLLNRGALNEALEYYQRLIKSDRARFKFIGLNNAGLVLQKMGDYESAIEYHTRAFEITKEEIGFTESDQAQVFLNVANAYFREGNVKLAKTAYENLLSFYGKNPPALLLNNLGLCELDLGNLAEANQFFNQAIAKADSLEEFEYQLNQVIAFRQMGKLQKAYREVLKLEPNTEKEELDWLLQVLELGIQLENEVALESQFETAIEKVNNLSRRILDPISRLKFRGNFQRIYQLATLYYSKKWKQTNDLAAFEKAFSIAEKGKSLTLLESVIQKQLTSFAGVPNEVLEEEIQILQKGNQLEFENLLEELKSKYPQYYELKFASPSISLEAVQELLNPNQTLLSYSLSGNDLIIFQIKKDAKNIIIQPIVKELNSQLPKLNRAIQNYPKLVGDDLAKALKEYQTIAFSLYQKLIPQPELLTEELIIIPDGVLHYLSFECLLSERTTNDKFKFYPYLINSKSISYCYSASFLEQLKKRASFEADECLLSVAPDFENSTYGLGHLRYNESEAQKVADLFNGDLMVGEQAILSAFLAKADQYSILHLASHGMANDRSGDASFLAFTEIDDGEDNEWLYAKKIYEHPLNASLVVLSACQTGLGELQQGEGLMGLSRAFFFNNAKTVVPTLWSVDDLSNSEIIVSFFENLKLKNDHTSSLRNAKLTYIQNHKNPECHPVFWAAPILVGVGDELVGCSGSSSWWIWGLSLILIGIVIYYLWQVLTPK